MTIFVDLLRRLGPKGIGVALLLVSLATASVLLYIKAAEVNSLSAKLETSDTKLSQAKNNALVLEVGIAERSEAILECNKGVDALEEKSAELGKAVAEAQASAAAQRKVYDSKASGTLKKGPEFSDDYQSTVKLVDDAIGEAK